MREAFPKIVVTGSIARDYIETVDQSLLELLQQAQHLSNGFNISVLTNSLEARYGGTGANIVYTMGILGMYPILLGSSGPDSKEQLQHLQNNGVNISYVHESNRMTSKFSVMNDPYGSQFASFHIGAMGDSATLNFSRPELRDTDLAIISAHDPNKMLEQVQQCVNEQITYVFDPGQQVNNTGDVGARLLSEGVGHAQFLFVNQNEIETIATTIGASVADITRTVPVTVVTQGAAGVHLYTREDHGIPLAVKAARVENVVDATGAGDAFRAGFFYAYLLGKSLFESCEYGSVAAAYCVEQKGGQSHQFTVEQFEQRHTDNFSS